VPAEVGLVFVVHFDMAMRLQRVFIYFELHV